MRGLAAAAGVNPASFTRLAQALGYAGWDELRDALIETGRSEPAMPFSSRVPGADPDPLWVAGAMVEADSAGLARVAPGPIAASQIWVAGFRSCRSVAVLLQYPFR